jgi:hypothetical protein
MFNVNVAISFVLNAKVKFIDLVIVDKSKNG